jgi:hypothetical protein
MKANSKKYLDFLQEVYLAEKPINISRFAKEKGVTSNIVTYLKKGSYIKEVEKGKYDWVGREPDEAMILELLQMQSDVNKVAKDKSKKSEKKSTKKRTPMAIIFDQVWEGIALAEKYGVPRDQWKDFVLEVYYTKKKKIDINKETI